MSRVRPGVLEDAHEAAPLHERLQHGLSDVRSAGEGDLGQPIGGELGRPRRASCEASLQAGSRDV